MLDAHDGGGRREASAYLERSCGHPPRVDGRGAGRAGRRARGGAAFLHRTSRAGDPQLHTHVLVANMTRGPDGRWTALDGRALYAHARTAGYLYQATLRAELTVGSAWSGAGSQRSGRGRRRAGPVLKAFSQRRAEIEAALRDHGARGTRAARVAALATRRAKDYGVTAETLREDWQRRAATLGLSERRLAAALGRTAGREPTEDDSEALFDRLAGPDGLTGQRSTFTRGEVIRTLCEAVPVGTGAEAIVEAADTFVDARAVRLLEQDAKTREARYSTPEMLAVEQRVLTTAGRLQRAGRGVATATATGRALARLPHLSDEQVAMVRRLTTDGDGVSIVIGKAGTGKTTALAAAREAWAASGLPVQGCAVARRAATQLGRDAAMPSTSISALERGDGLERSRSSSSTRPA